MRNFTIIVLFILSFIGIKAQQVTNGGFESWTGSYPDSWYTFTEYFIANGLPPADTLERRTTNSHSGNYAIRMRDTMNLPGIVIYGRMFGTWPTLFVKGNPYTYSPVSYDFWYEFSPVGGDSASTAYILTKWNIISNRPDTLAGGQVFLHAASNWTHVTVSMNYYLSGTPDTLLLGFQSCNTTPPPTGSTLTVDDVNINTASGIQNISSGISANVFPNPTSSTMTIKIGNENAKYVTIYDITGRQIEESTLLNQQINVNVSSFVNGIYIYSVFDSTHNVLATSKFIVSKN